MLRFCILIAVTMVTASAMAQTKLQPTWQPVCKDRWYCDVNSNGPPHRCLSKNGVTPALFQPPKGTSAACNCSDKFGNQQRGIRVKVTECTRPPTGKNVDTISKPGT